MLLYTGQRRSDVVRMGRQHLVPGGIEVRQVKTEKRLVIPLHPTLQAELHRQPRDKLTFLLTAYGRAFASGGAFYNWFAEKAREAGLDKGLSPHGSGKALLQEHERDQRNDYGWRSHGGQLAALLRRTLTARLAAPRRPDARRAPAHAVSSFLSR